MSAVTQLPDAPHRSGVRDRDARDELSVLQVYDALSQAADLVCKASRLLRGAHQPDLGFRLYDIADEIHAEIRRCPYQPAAPQHSRSARSPATDPPSS